MVALLGARGSARRQIDGGRLGALSQDFASSLGSDDVAWPAGGVVGLEHEYEVTLHGQPVDFRELIHELDLGQRYLDPADPNAYRLASGTSLTADEAEAELALPPVAVEPGFGCSLAMAAAGERRQLKRLLPVGCELRGYSTHLSVAVPDQAAEEVARLYVRTFAPALMLLMDDVTSPGLLVRPRPGRVELGGEYVDGERLAAAALFAVGSVRACLDAVMNGTRTLSSVLEVKIRPDDRRYGWFVGRDAFGGDLYRAGRDTILPVTGSGTVSVQEHLVNCRHSALSTLDAELASESASLDAMVFGSHPLPVGAGDSSDRTSSSRLSSSPFGSLLASRARPGYDLAPVMLSWERAVFVLATPDRTRTAFANVPGPHLAQFEAALDGGNLDRPTLRYLAQPPARRRLDRRWRTVTGLYDELGPRVELLAPERGAVKSRRFRGAKRRSRS